MIDKITGNNNAKDDKSNDDAERNPDQSANNDQFQVNANDVVPQENSDDSNCSNQPNAVAKKSKVSFQEMPKHSPININALGLRRSLHVDGMKKKQLDPTLNHVGFIQVNEAPEEENIDLMKEMRTFKEAVTSPYKKNFVEAMEKEVRDHFKREHWTYYKISEVPIYKVLRSTWVFRTKRNRSAGDVVKFKARFCADGKT